VAISNHYFESSVSSSALLRESILGAANFELGAYFDSVQSSKSMFGKLKSEYFSKVFNGLIGNFAAAQQRNILRTREYTSSWLSVLPFKSHHFDLCVQKFRDALALRYRKSLLNLPSVCNGCGSLFSVEHALDCRVGGLVCQRHNEVRDAVCDLASLAWGQVQKEPVVCEEKLDDPSSMALIVDVRVCGVWQSQVDALFDVRVVDMDAPSYQSHSPQAVLHIAEVEKRRKYGAACQARRASFTPLCFSVGGLFRPEADYFLRRFADSLSTKWDKNYSVVMGYVRSRLSYAIIRAALLCVWGSRTKWRSLGLVDGAAIDEISPILVPTHDGYSIYMPSFNQFLLAVYSIYYSGEKHNLSR